MYGSADWRERGALADDEIARVVLGTAGHIDHGKTALVQALTGVDPDRLAEEKRRGMTIDLGFAPLELEGRAVGVVDVPGHERFVKNMVAGSTGVDLVLLVVAADDGVMPQTREHLEILDVLGLRSGAVALTKIDRPGVDAELLAALEGELDELLAGTFLAGAPRLRVSACTGEGIAALRETLARLVRGVERRPVAGPFRMPVQRVFSIKGFGTVLTGIPLSGCVTPGERVVVHDARGQLLEARVRGVQAYGRPAERARAGHSSALNLADLDRKAVTRGDTLASPDSFHPGELFEVRLRALGLARPAFGKRTPVRVHLGTAEVLGEVVLLDATSLDPGERALAQLRLRAPVVALPGDRFVLRRSSPLETLGGGVILGRSRWRLKAFRPFVLERLARREAALGDPDEQALVELEANGREGLSAGSPELREAAGSLGFTPDELLDALRRLVRAGRAAEAPAGTFLTLAESKRRERVLSALRERTLAALVESHRQHPTRAGATKSELRQRLESPDESQLDAALAALCAADEVRLIPGSDPSRYAASAHQPALPREWEPLKTALLEEMRRTGPEPGARTQLERCPPHPAARAREVLDYLLEVGEAVQLDDVVVQRSCYEESVARVRAALAAGPASLGALRDALRANRRFAVALLEHLDREGVTRREGGVRLLAEP